MSEGGEAINEAEESKELSKPKSDTEIQEMMIKYDINLITPPEDFKERARKVDSLELWKDRQGQ